MKLNFTISYRTRWGESLCVALIWIGRGGYVSCQNVKMFTRDGYHWAAETKAQSNRQHPWMGVAYCYKVVDADGNVLRCESTEHPRIYPFDESKSYVCNDFWLEGEYRPDWIENLEVPLLPIYGETVFFQVAAPRLCEGEALALLGNHPALGSWQETHYLRMTPRGDGSWVLSVDVQAIDCPLEYKYVVIDEKTQALKRWEEGVNRNMDGIRVSPGEVHVLHGGMFRVKDMPTTAQFNFDTYIFDLDGTLLSTLADLAASCNYALHEAGMPEHSLDDVRRFVGNGVRLLMERAVPDGANNPRFDDVYACFRQHYMMHNLDTTKPYPGIIDMLTELKARGKQIAVVSNKFYAATQALCRHFFGSLVDVAIGEREDIKKKPAPDTVNEALRQLGARRERAVYIGDSDVDIMTARNSGMPCISVLWGFRDREFLIRHEASIFVSSPSQIL